jgi:putative transposase
MKLHKQAHTVYKTQYHIVWVTRFRRKILTPGIASFFTIALHEVREHYPDWYFTAIGTDKDHVHLHMEIPPRYSVSEVVNILKTNTSRALHARFAHFLDKVYWDRGGIWAKGYFVSTVGINEDVIKNYVLMQGAEDSGQAQLEL